MLRPAATVLAVALAAPALAQGGDAKKDAPPSTPAPAAAAPAPLPALPNWPDKPVSTTTTPSGVVVEEFKAGTGTELKAGVGIVANYRGSLKDTGKQFASSYDTKTYLLAPLWGLIKGMQDGLVGMKVGGMRKLHIPTALAYGEAGRSGIPPRADLVFEVELIDCMVIEDLRVGDGEEFKPGGTVTCHYLGTLKSDGSKVDSSYDSNQPLTFGAGLPPVIKGWDFGVPFMRVGGKRRLTIPWQLAYGERGYPGAIPPKADLVFEIEVLSVKNAPPPPPPAAPQTPANK